MFKLIALVLLPILTYAQEPTCVVKQDKPFGNPNIGSKFSSYPLIAASEKPGQRLQLSYVETCQNAAGALLGIRFGLD